MLYSRFNKYEKLLVQMQKGYLVLRRNEYKVVRLIDLVTLKQTITITNYEQEIALLYTGK